MIDTEKAALCARIDDLCAEVERLKQQNAMLRELENIRISQVKYCEDLDAENSKLRELVRDYDHCVMYADCSRCEYDGKLSTHCPLSPCFPDTDELRELGVEVD